MLEPVVAWLEEKFPGKRKQMALVAGFAIWILGLGSVLSFSIMADVEPLAFMGIEKNFFGIADYTVANVLAPVNALMIALFAGWVLSNKVVNEEFAADTPNWKIYWRFANRFLAPAALIIVLIDLVIGWEYILQAW